MLQVSCNRMIIKPKNDLNILLQNPRTSYGNKKTCNLLCMKIYFFFCGFID